MEPIKDKRRWNVTKILLGTVIIGFFLIAALAAYGVTVSGVTTAYAAYVSFSAAIIATNLATKPGKE